MQRKLVKLIPFFVLIFFSLSSAAQDASNLWLFTIDEQQPNTIKSATQVTNNQDYSNQPHFIADTNALYFTQAFKANGVSQTDAMRFDIASGQISNLTQSATSEYSPTPYQTGFSTILVDKNNKQWLWAFAADGSSVGKIIAVEPVGYHVWVDEQRALAFVVGEPHTLQLLSKTDQAIQLDDDIGPSLWKIPNTETFSYTKQIRVRDKSHTALYRYDPVSQDVSQLTDMPEGAMYYAWLPDGSAITAVNSRVLRWSQKQNDQQWQTWLDLSEWCGSASRIHSRSLAGSVQLAVVCH